MKKETLIGSLTAAIGTAIAVGKGVIDGIKSSTDLKTQKLEKAFLKEFDAVRNGGDTKKATEALFLYMHRMRYIENISVSYNRLQRVVCMHYWDKDREQLKQYSDTVLTKIWGSADAKVTRDFRVVSDKAQSEYYKSCDRNEKEDDAISRIKAAFFDEIVGTDTDTTRAMVNLAQHYLINEIGYSRVEMKAVLQKLREIAGENVERVKNEVKNK